MSSIDTSSSCIRNERKLPHEWRNILIEKYNRAKERNAWADFNCAAKAHREFEKGSTPIGYSLFCQEDVPSFPDPDNFLDLEKERNCIRD